MQRPYFAAAREVASSPSGCASFIDAAGLKPNGSDTCLSIRVGTAAVRFCGESRRITYLAAKELGGCVDFVDVD